MVLAKRFFITTTSLCLSLFLGTQNIHASHVEHGPEKNSGPINTVIVPYDPATEPNMEKGLVIREIQDEYLNDNNAEYVVKTLVDTGVIEALNGTLRLRGSIEYAGNAVHTLQAAKDGLINYLQNFSLTTNVSEKPLVTVTEADNIYTPKLLQFISKQFLEGKIWSNFDQPQELRSIQGEMGEVIDHLPLLLLLRYFEAKTPQPFSHKNKYLTSYIFTLSKWDGGAISDQLQLSLQDYSENKGFVNNGNTIHHSVSGSSTGNEYTFEFYKAASDRGIFCYLVKIKYNITDQDYSNPRLESLVDILFQVEKE